MAKSVKNVEELTPDEIAEKILGSSEGEEADESFDLEDFQFWLKSLHGQQIEDFFKEKTRVRLLVDQFLKKGYDEQTIFAIFQRVQKAEVEKEKDDVKSQEKFEKLKRKLFLIGVSLLSVFVFFYLNSKAMEIAAEKRQIQIRAAKTLRLKLSSRGLVYYRTNFKARWEKLSRILPAVNEFFILKSEVGSQSLLLPNNGTLAFLDKSEFKINEILLGKNEKKISSINLELRKGKFHWNIPEGTQQKITINLPGTIMKIKYGNGKIDLTQTPPIIKVAEGENKIKLPKDIVYRSFNGLMQATIDGKNSKIKIYEEY